LDVVEERFELGRVAIVGGVAGMGPPVVLGQDAIAGRVDSSALT
jgi:hypothetical protein